MPKATHPQSEELASNPGVLDREVCAHSHDPSLSNMTQVTVTGGMAAANTSQALPVAQGDLTQSS